MRISLFSHNANPRVDAALCHKSKTYIALLLEKGEAIMLDERSAQLQPPQACQLPALALIGSLADLATKGAISDGECSANVGVGTPGQVFLAQQKVRAYPGIFDELAVSTRWPAADA
jgi:hypothetical protein